MDTGPALAPMDFDRSGQHLTVYIAGELDEVSAPALAAAIIENTRPGDEVIRLDVADVTFCSSAGITMLLRLAQYVGDMGGRLRLYNATSDLKGLLATCYLDENLSTGTDRGSA